MVKLLKKSIFAPLSFPKLPDISGLVIQTGCSAIKYRDRDDVLLVYFHQPAVTAAVFTKSTMPSAAVDFSKAALEQEGFCKALIVNAGNANAFTGQAGIKACQIVSERLSVAYQCPHHQIMQASTGVIGVKLDGEIIAQTALGLKQHTDFEAAAKAIMTTDTFAKAAGISVTINGKQVNISGIAKGSGMIAPNMGTMLCFIFTDVSIEQSLLQKLVQQITQTTFNAITVDGDTSTSDHFAVFATAAGKKISEDFEIQAFKEALNQVTHDLAMQIVKDGEGLTKFITIQVHGALNDESARKIGLSIANSPLVKTAIAGEDANWGRIIAAIGKSGEVANRDKTTIIIGGVTIATNGEAVENYDEAPIAAHMKKDDIYIAVDVGVAQGRSIVYTTDLTHGYIDINADYRS